MDHGLPHPAHPSPIGQYLGQIIAEWRAAKGWSRSDLQRAAGIDHCTIQHLEDGHSGGRSDTLDRLSIALDRDIGCLFAEAQRRRREQGGYPQAGKVRVRREGFPS